MLYRGTVFLSICLINTVLGGIFDREFSIYPYAKKPIFDDTRIPAEFEINERIREEEVEQSELRMPGVTLSTVSLNFYRLTYQ